MVKQRLIPKVWCLKSIKSICSLVLLKEALKMKDTQKNSERVASSLYLVMSFGRSDIRKKILDGGEGGGGVEVGSSWSFRETASIAQNHSDTSGMTRWYFFQSRRFAKKIVAKILCPSAKVKIFYNLAPARSYIGYQAFNYLVQSHCGNCGITLQKSEFVSCSHYLSNKLAFDTSQAVGQELFLFESNASKDQPLNERLSSPRHQCWLGDIHRMEKVIIGTVNSQ